METGAVKWYSRKKGFGFIKREGQEDIFIHKTGIDPQDEEHVAPGDIVEFEVVDNERGLKAINVRLQRGCDKSASNRSSEGTRTGGKR